METKKRLPILWAAVVTLVVVYLTFQFLAPYISMLIVGKDRPLPLPSTLLFIYMILTLIGLGIFITTSDRKIEEFKSPLVNFLKGGQPGLQGILRTVVLVMVPFLVGWVVYTRTAPNVKPPVMIRVQHPTMPGRFESMVNPMREPTDAMIKKYAEKYRLSTFSGEEARKVFVEEATAEGRNLFQINCRPCHGTKANGAGPMARGFRLKPADFTDSGTIATVVENYAFWRVRKGGLGLPDQATPWDSAMPVWERDLTEEEIWKIIMAEYDIADKEPRKPEGAAQ